MTVVHFANISALYPWVVISSLAKRLEKSPFCHSYTSFGVWPRDHYMPLQRFTMGRMSGLAKVVGENRLWWLSMKQNSARLYNSKEMATGATRNLELLIEEFQSILSFWAAGLSSRGKEQGWVHLWLVLSKCKNKMIMQGNSRIKLKK
jgi:hypothetical protein